jgi:hypothetical protein
MKKGDKKKMARQQKKHAERQESRRGARGREPSLVSNAVRGASQYPLEGCWAQEDWQDGGLAVVTVARRLPSQAILYARLLVDYYCLGVKDADTGMEPSPERFRNVVLPGLYRAAAGPMEIAADLAHELIYGAIDYAARWGFRPHRDFSVARHVLDPQDAHPVSGRVTFGYQGKPLFVAGPYDNAQAIMAKLERTADEGHYNYLLSLGSSPDLGNDAVWADDEDDWEDDPDEGRPPRQGGGV